MSVRTGAANADITHVALSSGPGVLAQQAPSQQFHAVNVVHSRSNHPMLQRAAVSPAQPQGGFWDTVMVRYRNYLVYIIWCTCTCIHGCLEHMYITTKKSRLSLYMYIRI